MTQKKRESELKTVRNHNYTITVSDNSGKKLNFRDITGNDLEFIESLFIGAGDDDTSDGPKTLSFDGIISLVSLLNIDEINIKCLTNRAIYGLFLAIKENILCNFMPKINWLKTCYSIQNGSFSGVSEMEKVPMTKFVAMAQVHREAVENIGNND